MEGLKKRLRQRRVTESMNKSKMKHYMRGYRAKKKAETICIGEEMMRWQAFRRNYNCSDDEEAVQLLLDFIDRQFLSQVGMPVVEKEGMQSKIKNVAKKSTTKRPHSQFRNYTGIRYLKERDTSTVAIDAMDSTDTTNVYEETLDNLKSLNGASVKETWDNSDTELKILSTESVQDNGLLDKIPSEDAVEHVSTDEEDNLLNLSDAESQDNNLNNDQNMEKNTDSASHQFAIGVQVRNSVRDIMSKLVKDGSPEVNKILAKPKGDDSSRTNSPKTIKPYCENKSDLNAGSKIVKGNLFEIMSAESVTDDAILDSSSKPSNILSVEVGEDTNNFSVSIKTKPQSNTNTQDNTISSLFLSDQISVINSAVGALSADNSDIINNSVSATNSIGSLDSSDKVSYILESVNEDCSNLSTLQKLESNQDKVLNRTNRENSHENKTSNLRHSNLFSNFETPSDNLISNTNINKSNIIEFSENKLKFAENVERNNLETVDMDVSNDIEQWDRIENSDSFKDEVCEIPLKTVQPYDDISDSNDSGNNKPGSLQLVSKQGTYSDNDILDLNENLDSPKPEYSKPVDVKVGKVLNEKDNPKIFSEEKTDFKSNSFDNKEDTIKVDSNKSVNPFQFSVDDDDNNSNSNIFAKINIDEICDNLLMDEPKPDVSVSNKVKDDKVEDEKGGNDSNLMKKSKDVGVGMKIESLDMASNEKVESLKEPNTIGVSDEEKINKTDLNLDDGKIQKPEGMDIDDTIVDKPESESNVESHIESNCSTSSKLQSMDIDNSNDFKSEIKTEMKKVVKIDFSCRSDEKCNIDQDNKVKQDDKSDIKVDLDKKKSVKDEKTESMGMDNDNIRFNSLSKIDPPTTFRNIDSKSIMNLDIETKIEENIDKKSEIVAERKRSGESPNTESQAPPKRSRLDIMIGKLGSQIGIAPESVPDPIDCDTLSDSETESKEGSEDAKSEDEESKSMMEDDDAKTIYEEMKKKDCLEDSTDGATVKEKASTVKTVKDEKDKQEARKEMIKESEPAISEPKKIESLKEPEEVNYSATTISDDEDDDVKVIEEPIKSSDTIQSLKNKDISYDSEVNLDQVIRKRVLQLIKSYRDETIAALQTKVNFLTKTTEQWKNTSKELQKQVVDLTIVQQRLDKRKAATAALKSITSRSIGCQVDTTKLQNGSDMLKSPPKPVKYTSYTTVPPNTGQNMVSMIKQQPRPTPSVTTPVVNNMSQLLSATAESRNTNINNVRQGAGVSSVRNLLETTGRANITQTSLSTSAKNVSYSGKVIDLTADEENTKKLSNSQVKPPIMVPVSNIPIGSSQLPGLPPGASILLSGPSGTQIVNHQFNKMSGALQVVTVSSGSQIRPGQFLTVLPSTAVTSGNIRPQPVTMTTTVPSVTSIGTTPVRQAPPTSTPAPTVKKTLASNHPAPLPPQPINRTPNGGVKGLVPPKPDLKISRVSQGIVLSWTITQNLSLYSEIASYQLFAYQEGSTPPHSNLWKKVGDVKALPLPMACTLTQFQEGNKYHFAVRAIDVYQRISDFSEPSSIHLFAL